MPSRIRTEPNCPKPQQYTFLTLGQWLKGITCGAILACAAYPLYAFISGWIGVTIFIATLCMIHMYCSAHRIVPFPHLMVLIAALQYVLAAWVAAYFPSDVPIYNIGAHMPVYFSYTGPALMALCMGLAAPLLLTHCRKQATTTVTPALLRELDVLILVGIIAAFVNKLVKLEGLSFAFALASYLRYVGAFGRMILGERGWLVRVGALFTADLVVSTGSTMFHSFILWSLWAFGIWLFCAQPRLRVALPLALVGILLLPAIQFTKWELRDQIAQEEDTTDERKPGSIPIHRLLDSLNYLGKGLLDSICLNYDPEFVSDTAVRYNQGWIISRVMLWVPDEEPYARGETLLDAFRAAVLPRFLAPGKVVAGGRENVARFTGLELGREVSMNLGYAGEMYANFGKHGGIVGCGFYGLFFGVILSYFARRGSSSPIWWCIAPFVLNSALKAEDGIAEVLNWTVKAIVVITCVILLFPNLRSALFTRGFSCNDQNEFGRLSGVDAVRRDRGRTKARLS